MVRSRLLTDRRQGLPDSIFIRYGGFASVSRVVSDFYGRVSDSKVLTPYFEGIDMARLIDHQTKFIATLMGGPASYSDEHIERVHAHMGITDEAFREAALLLRETLEKPTSLWWFRSSW